MVYDCENAESTVRLFSLLSAFIVLEIFKDRVILISYVASTVHFQCAMQRDALGVNRSYSLVDVSLGKL